MCFCRPAGEPEGQQSPCDDFFSVRLDPQGGHAQFVLGIAELLFTAGAIISFKHLGLVVPVRGLRIELKDLRVKAHKGGVGRDRGKRRERGRGEGDRQQATNMSSSRPE